jgi:hypothetical protein
MERKIEDYKKWQTRHGHDPIVARAMEEVQDIKVTRHGSTLLPVLP